jgi:hypothetical protein
MTAYDNIVNTCYKTAIVPSQGPTILCDKYIYTSSEKAGFFLVHTKQVENPTKSVFTFPFGSGKRTTVLGMWSNNRHTYISNLYDIFSCVVKVHNIGVTEIWTAKYDRMQLRPILRCCPGHTTDTPNDMKVVLPTEVVELYIL